jgi:lysophospholipase L1-like esterase
MVVAVVKTRVNRSTAGIALVVAAFALAGAGVASSGPAAKFNPPKSYYLALGDSITYGVQNAKLAAGLPPAAFAGYAGPFADRLRVLRPEITVVNYGCPGESTSTFIAGSCLGKLVGNPLHDDYEGSQLDAATAFLDAHPGQVSPITLHLFGNDLREFIATCGGNFECIRARAPTAIAEFAARLGTILEQIRTSAPEAEIIVIGAWNSRVDFLAESDPLIQALNGAIATVASQERAILADVVPSFNPDGSGPRIAAICSLTLLCSDLDTHPSDAGYLRIAEIVFDASGYARLGE